MSVQGRIKERLAELPVKSISFSLLLALLCLLLLQQSCETMYKAIAPNDRMAQRYIEDGRLLVQWSGDAAQDSLRFSFRDHDLRINEVRRHFTPEGWAGYEAFLKESGLQQKVAETQTFVSARLLEAPVILERKTLPGQYGWTVQMPCTIDYEIAGKTSSTSVLITLRIKQSDDPRNFEGIGISSWTAEPL